jgi:hypothetical protein
MLVFEAFFVFATAKVMAFVLNSKKKRIFFIIKNSRKIWQKWRKSLPLQADYYQ